MFKEYKRTAIAEMREVTESDIMNFDRNGCIPASCQGLELTVSISDADKLNGSPKFGDMVARNPKDHSDQWLVAKQYFLDNFEEK